MGYKKKSTMDDIFEICALLPWWVGASIAVISYFILHHFAVAEVVNNGDVGQLMVDNIKKSVSTVAQYLVPAICGAGALVSALKSNNHR